MSYTKEDLREAFYAGKLGGISFDSWLVKSKSFNQLISLYQECFIKFIDKPASYALNSQTLECSRMKIILRGLLKQKIPNLTSDLLAEVEYAVGSIEKTDPSTISYSVKRFNEAYSNHYITGQVKKLIDKLDL